jgi:dienelactone hydrolase
MRTTLLTAAALLGLVGSAAAAQTTKKIPYDIDKTKFEGVLIYDADAGVKPGIVLVPNWMGINDANIKQAQEVAARGYTVFVADMYGLQARPKTMEDAGKVAGQVKGDRALMRKRVNKALGVFTAQKGLPLDEKKIAAIGFCFGGTSALELARSGAPIAAVVSFHGGLSSPTPADAKNIKGKVLALHGADDPSVPPDEVKGFEDEMRGAKVDWQLVSFGNTVHGFTDPNANMAGRVQYNETSARRSYVMMDNFLAEAFH